MKADEAIKVLQIEGEYTPESIKLAYRKLCAMYHPDRNPAGLEMMKLINEAYSVLKDTQGTASESTSDDIDLSSYCETINAAINAIIGLHGLIIEISGTWVWVSGETREHKEAIKQAGFMWAMKKKMWFFRPADSVSKSRGKCSIDKIRSMHGSQMVHRQERRRLAA